MPASVCTHKFVCSCVSSELQHQVRKIGKVKPILRSLSVIYTLSETFVFFVFFVTIASHFLFARER